MEWSKWEFDVQLNFAILLTDVSASSYGTTSINRTVKLGSDPNMVPWPRNLSWTHLNGDTRDNPRFNWTRETLNFNSLCWVRLVISETLSSALFRGMWCHRSKGRGMPSQRDTQCGAGCISASRNNISLCKQKGLVRVSMIKRCLFRLLLRLYTVVLWTEHFVLSRSLLRRQIAHVAAGFKISAAGKLQLFLR
jgi:hypothetical protein